MAMANVVSADYTQRGSTTNDSGLRSKAIRHMGLQICSIWRRQRMRYHYFQLPVEIEVCRGFNVYELQVS